MSRLWQSLVDGARELDSGVAALLAAWGDD